MAAVLQADKELDCKGMLCPMPVIKVSKEIKSMQVGQVLKMIATDKGSPADMQAWARQTGNQILDAHEEGNLFIFFVQRVK